MAEEFVQENIAAILTADVVGYGHNTLCPQGNPVGSPLAARVSYGIEERTM